MIRCDVNAKVGRTEIKAKIYLKEKRKGDVQPVFKTPEINHRNICTNASCRLRKAGCRGFEGCPGYMSK
jgi:hypothetical protein